MGLRPTFFGLEIARTGLIVSQKGMDVTGHNVANVDTEGYTRQRLVLTANDPYNVMAKFKPMEMGLVGYGARVIILDQIRSAFFDRQYRTELSLYSKWSMRTESLTRVQSMYEGSELSDLKNSVSDLFTSFMTMTQNPFDREQRTITRISADSLCERLSVMHERHLVEYRNMDTGLSQKASRINEIADSIAELNKNILAFEMDGQPANDLRDKRNLLLDELSEYADITYSGDAIGERFTVKIGTGDVAITLVSHVTTNKIKITQGMPEEQGVPTEPAVSYDGKPLTYLSILDTDNNAIDLRDIVKNGELRAYYDMRDNNTETNPGVPYFIEQLNKWARDFAKAVNDIHLKGYTLETNVEDSETGIYFFTLRDADGDALSSAEINAQYGADPGDVYANITAANLCVSKDIMEDVTKIAASDEPIAYFGTDGEPVNGNANIIRDLYALLDSTNVEGINTVLGFLDAVQLDVAETLKYSKNMTEIQLIQILNADELRISISGVSLDEEMTNLIRYQHAYQGASRVITAMDEALDLMINRMGRVGL